MPFQVIPSFRIMQTIFLTFRWMIHLLRQLTLSTKTRETNTSKQELQLPGCIHSDLFWQER
ncbi:hypothetical protein BT69DRAFT_1284836 [Atractiella rhizophila]|nr:hypothetical protein BT69DRAFT_1284836 [Atractiella rhizophila]